MMSGLPDELWRRILELGIRVSSFTYRDLCCVSISCRRLHRLSSEDFLWSHLLSSDFPQQQQPDSRNTNPSSSSSSSSSAKSIYKIRFERERDRKVAAHRRALLRKESQIAEHKRKIREIEARLGEESEKMRAAVAELSNLRKARQASVALNVWQPEVVKGRQKQLVEQCGVSVEFRVHTLEMELKLCKQQIAGFNKAYRDEKQMLDKGKEELGSMKYHPLQDYTLTIRADNECNLKRKKLKRCLDSI